MEIKALAILICLITSPAFANPVISHTPCPYDPESLLFKGTATSQATCLLRGVMLWGHISSSPVVLPDTLERRIGQKVLLTAPQLRSYLTAEQIKEKDIGGNLDRPVSNAETQKKGKYPAKYFVIHDTSTPKIIKTYFPEDINAATWEHNNLTTWQKGEKSKAHIFISRVGLSVTAMPFERGWRSTKFELTYAKRYPLVPNEEVRGRFLHIELVQPRRPDEVTDKNASKERIENGAVAPMPGFTDVQYRRLALVYIAASLRAGEWLIPVYHAGLDLELPGAHDDPQNFDLNLWAKELQILLNEIGT